MDLFPERDRPPEVFETPGRVAGVAALRLGEEVPVLHQAQQFVFHVGDEVDVPLGVGDEQSDVLADHGSSAVSM